MTILLQTHLKKIQAQATHSNHYCKKEYCFKVRSKQFDESAEGKISSYRD